MNKEILQLSDTCYGRVDELIYVTRHGAKLTYAFCYGHRLEVDFAVMFPTGGEEVAIEKLAEVIKAMGWK